MKVQTYAAMTAGEALAPYEYESRELRESDVAIDIKYCGVCHSDLHSARDDWGFSVFPCVPGHEIVGVVSAVGYGVTKYKIGDSVAVGCMVDSCLSCKHCHNHEEQFCTEGFTMTYGGKDRVTGELTYGGYANHIVVREEFVLSIPKNLDMAKAAPLLCAGITTYSPLRYWGVGPGSKIAVLGMGGLGHMAIKLAVGLGAHVTVISRSPNKEKDARELGADEFLLSSDTEAMQNAASKFDVIIDTVPVDHEIEPYIPLLEVGGTHVIVGQLGQIQANTIPMLFGRRRIATSLIGGIAETQEMLDFCGKMNILPECEMIKMQDINEAFERLEKSDVHYRFVIDMDSMNDA